jgi:hypothetical protein
MADRLHIDDHESAEEFIVPEGVQKALDDNRASPEFMARCREAALAAYDISRLRQVREETGFLCAPFHEYLRELARRLDLSLERITRSLAIEDMATLDRPGIRPLARLGQELGLARVEVRALLRTSLAVATEHAPAQPLPLNRAPDQEPLPALDACNRFLAQIESHYQPAEQARLRMIYDEVDAQFDAER